jgi:hypothetical protein
VTTRRQLLAAGAFAAAGLRAPAARAGRLDTGTLELLATYADTVVVAYDVALRRAPLHSGDRPRLLKLRGAAESDRASLRSTVARRGATLPASLGIAAVPAAPAWGRADYLRAIVGSEETFVAGWYEALQSIVDPVVTGDGGAFMARAGRRLVVLREMASLPLLPRAFETGGL